MLVRLVELHGKHRCHIELVPHAPHQARRVKGKVRLDQCRVVHLVEQGRLTQGSIAIDIIPRNVDFKDPARQFRCCQIIIVDHPCPYSTSLNASFGPSVTAKARAQRSSPKATRPEYASMPSSRLNPKRREKN